MITLKKLQIYERFDGDIDWLQRAGSSAEQAAISGAEWGRIGELIHLLTVIERGLAADSLVERTYIALEREVEEKARVGMRKLASQEV